MLAYVALAALPSGSKLNKQHMKYLIHVVKYTVNTRHYKITYNRNNENVNRPCVFTDASNKTRYYGYISMMNSGPVAWACSKLKFMPMSSKDAEIPAGHEGAREAVHEHHLVKELLPKQKLSPIPVKIDCNPAIACLRDKRVTSRTKHIDRSKMRTQQWQEDKMIDVTHVKTEHNPADVFTKILDGEKLLYLNSIIFGITWK